MNTEALLIEECVKRRWRNDEASWRTIDLGPVEFLPCGEGCTYIKGATVTLFQQIVNSSLCYALHSITGWSFTSGVELAITSEQ